MSDEARIAALERLLHDLMELCGTASRLAIKPKGIDEVLSELRQERAAVLSHSLQDQQSRAAVRDYLRKALLTEGNLAYLYKHFPNDFPLEEDLSRRLRAFQRTDTNDPYKSAVPDLKLLRRRAFQRYGFRLAGQLNDHLRREGQMGLWLIKDFWLPRIPLALLVGYGVMMGGAFYSWLQALSASWLFLALFSAFCLSLSFGLISLNVRDRIGNLPREVGLRSARVFFTALGWTAVSTLLVRALACLSPGLNRSFEWKPAILTSEGALVIAIIVQFFFTTAGSIAEPL
jgi:hypothetical protein